MSKIYKGVLGPMQGKIDGLIGRYMYGKGLLQSKGNTGVVNGRVENTPAQDRMSWARLAVKRIDPTYWDYSLKPTKKTWSSRNEWIHRNFNLFDVLGNYTFSPTAWSVGKSPAPSSFVIHTWTDPIRPIVSVEWGSTVEGRVPNPLFGIATYNVTKKSFQEPVTFQDPAAFPLTIFMSDVESGDEVMFIFFAQTVQGDTLRQSSLANSYHSVCP